MVVHSPAFEPRGYNVVCRGKESGGEKPTNTALRLLRFVFWASGDSSLARILSILLYPALTLYVSLV
jgi:hypothetical protein